MTNKALIVACSYWGTGDELQGPDDNEKLIYEFLIGQGFTNDNIIELIEGTDDPNSDSTYQNIINSMAWLVNEAQEGDNLVFSYSGHGTTTADQNGDEMSGSDDCICPVDFRTVGTLTDDTMHEIMIPSVPSNAQLLCIFDSCFSGTVLDLPYTVETDGTVLEAVSSDEISQETACGQIVVLSGCADDQESVYTTNSGQWEGLLTAAFLDTMQNDPGSDLPTALQHVRDYIASQAGTQTAQLSIGANTDPTTVLFDVVEEEE